MRFFAISAAALAAVATPAFAQDAVPAFQGPYVGLSAGAESVSDGTDSAAGVVGIATVGYDLQLGNAFVVGAVVEGGLSTTKDCDDVAPVTCLKSGRDLYAGARIGLVSGDSTLVYIGAGYTNGQAKLTSGGNTVASNDLDGIRGTFGVETLLGGNVSLKGELRYSNYEASTERYQAVLGLGFRF